MKAKLTSTIISLGKSKKVYGVAGDTVDIISSQEDVAGGHVSVLLVIKGKEKFAVNKENLTIIN